MNWVGGIRNRIKLKQQKKQQKEFFEKRKLKSKFKLLGSPLSPQQNSSVSWDLLTLHIVNRIAAKKEPTDRPNKVIQVDMKKDTKMPIRQHNIELPMSPCSTPSRIFLEESQCSSQEKEWNSRTKHFVNMTNLKYGELSPVMESKSLEHNVMDNSLMERFSGYPLSDSWTCAQSYSLQENLSTELPTSWDSSNDNRQHLQQHFLIQGGMTPLTETIEHAAVLTEHSVANCRNLAKHSNGRLLQNSLMESTDLHSNNDEEYAFSVQDTFPLSPKVASTSQSMTFLGRDFPLTQCFNSENSQLLSSHVCQEEFMHNLLAPAETSFKISATYKRSDMPGTSVIGSKSVIQNRKNGSTFIQPAANLFKETVQKDHFGESNSHDEQFPESNLEFNVQENNGFFRGFEESWRSLNCRGTVMNHSFESSQSPSYSPKETESCCSVFSDLSELDGQIMQPDVSATNKGSAQEKRFDVQPDRENFNVQNVPQEYLRETNCTSQSCSYPLSKKVTNASIALNMVTSEQKEKPDQFVPSSSMNCSSETTNSKSFQVQNAWTQTEFSLIYMKRSDIAIQCNLSNATKCLSSPVKEPSSLVGDSSNFVHTIRGQYSPSNKYSHCSDVSTKKPAVLIENDLSFGNSFEEIDETKCLEVRGEGNIKTTTNFNNSLIPSSCSENEIQRPENQQIKQPLQNENEVCNLSGISKSVVWNIQR